MTIPQISSYTQEKTSEQKKVFIADRFREIMEVLGLNIENPSLKDTPNRVAKMYVDEIFQGLDDRNFPELTFFENHHNHNDMVFVKTRFVSICEHHFLPFFGEASIAYIPNTKLIGLSKIARIVQHFAKRPQMQEKLTQMITENFSHILDTEHVAVSMTAQHFCMIARGIEESNSYTTTHALRGDFKRNASLRKEFHDEVKNRFMKN